MVQKCEEHYIYLFEKGDQPKKMLTLKKNQLLAWLFPIFLHPYVAAKVCTHSINKTIKYHRNFTAEYTIKKKKQRTKD